MRISGVIPESELVGNCATCKHYQPLIKEWHGIKTKFARGGCSIRKYKDGGNIYKSRTETCKKWEES